MLFDVCSAQITLLGVLYLVLGAPCVPEILSFAVSGGLCWVICGLLYCGGLGGLRLFFRLWLLVGEIFDGGFWVLVRCDDCWVVLHLDNCYKKTLGYWKL